MPLFNQYQYKPLETNDTIRILVLDPATNFEAPLSGSLVHHATCTKYPNYWAISYVWGPQDFYNTLEIHSNDGETSYIRITSNVSTVLKRFRASAPNVRRCLWIDAICLNQNDAIEKAHQVPTMARMYEKARGVHIWLGPEDKDTAGIFGFLHDVVHVPSLGSRYSEKQLLRVMAKHLPKDSNPFAEFFLRPWFFRRWIVQEAWLARQASFYCGRHSVPLETMVKAAIRLQSSNMFDYATNMVADLGRPMLRVSMLELLYKFHAANCLDKRDRVAALFGLVPQENRFPIDYSVHWAEMYKQLATFVLKTGNHDAKLQLLLHLFEFGTISDPALDPSFPSWIPNWSKERQRILPLHYARLFPDSGNEYPSRPGYPSVSVLTFERDVFKIHWNPALAGLRGRRVTWAKHLSQHTTQKNQIPNNTLTILQELFPTTKSSAPHLLVFCSLVETLIQFLYIKAFQNRPIKTETFNQYLKSMRQELPETSDPGVLESLRYLGEVLQGYRLFVLDPIQEEPGGRRSYGFGPLSIREGDVMIPVWRPKSDPLHPDIDERAINFMTMLTVRCETSSEKGVFNERVVGPAVCSTARSTVPGAEVGLDLDTRPETPREGWHSLRLV